MERESFVFYQSFRRGTKHLPKDNQKNALVMMVEYGIDGIEPNPEIDQIAYAMFLMAKPQIDKNNLRFSNGGCGGRPKKDWKNSQKPKDNQTITKHKPNDNVNVNVNDNINNSDFDLFWNLYDKKIDKDKCYKKWIKLSDVERAAALNHIPQYKLSQPDKKFRKNPETYLNNKSWNNEIITGGLDYTNLNNFHDMMMQDKVPELKQALGLEKYFEIKKLRKDSPLYLTF